MSDSRTGMIRVFCAVSLDGFLAGPGDDLDWLTSIPNPGGTDFGFAAFLDSCDALIMGRRTFERVSTFDSWPYTLPVFVWGHRANLPETLPRAVEVLSGTPRELVRTLARRGFRNLYVDGGQTIRGFLAEDLVDELHLTLVAKLLGAGVPLWGPLPSREFEALAAEVLNPWLTRCVYRRRRPHLARFDTISEAAWADYVADWQPTGEPFFPMASDPQGRSFADMQVAWAEAETDAVRARGYVPSTLYFLVDAGGRLLGSTSFRHELSERLMLNGGHIGYGIRPSERRKGHGQRQLELVLQVACDHGLDRVLVTCDDNNAASARTIESVGGVLHDKPVFEGTLTRRYWIALVPQVSRE